MLHKFLISDAFIVFALVAVTTVFLTLILSFE